MKEGVGTMSVGRSSTQSIGNRGMSLAGGRGSNRGVGGFLSSAKGSPDRGSIAFGSSRLSEFKPSVSLPLSRPNSIININRGIQKAGMLDINRPVRSSPIISHESKFQFGLNVKNGTESKSARTESLKPRGIFDITRPISKSAIVSYEVKKGETFKHAPVSHIQERPGILSRSNNSEARARSLESKKIKLNNTFEFRKTQLESPKLKIVSNQEIKSKALMPTNAEVKKSNIFKEITLRREHSNEVINVDSIVGAIAKAQENAEKKAIRLKQHYEIKKQILKRVELKHRIKVLPSLDLDQAQLVRADIRKAKKLIPILVRAKGITIDEAQTEAVQILSAKHKNKIVITPVEPQVSPAISPEMHQVTQTDAVTKTKAVVLDKAETKHTLEVKMNTSQAMAIQAKNLEKLKKTQHRKEKDQGSREKLFFFEKDEHINKKRINNAMKALNEVLRSHKASNEKPSGVDVVRLIKDDTSMQSEVARLIHKDGSLDKFKEGIRMLKDIHKGSVDTIIKIAGIFSAVRLNTVATKQSVEKKQAEHVYNGPIDNQIAYFQDLGRVTGKFVETKEKTYFVPSTIYHDTRVS